ncbi:glycine-rich domain-containing protein [Acidocella sp. KAb 2-4]|uniref:glycine-rich domain-containing protein n=1 Tax=Acidocella sp. KAb 2-4 TaxID=2885158 RepID=UPI001D08EC85|nr:hypothetical protein [Acidocella sp. KAb 2-4]MCB5944110.1 hypothetical protein [Acidocella sp. KAb 2-4]
MDRNIVYPGSIPLDTDILYPNRNAMIGLAALTAATLGSNTVVDGLACTPTSPASMTVVVGPGSITQLSPLDATAYGSLAADVTDQIVKTGINLQATNFMLAVPANSGQAINYLIEAAFAETDTAAVVLPYVNAANPGQPYSGPNNAGTAQNTQRVQRVQLQVKPGAAASAGTQTTPAVDSGWVGLYVVTVNYGQTAIAAANIATLPGAPFLAYKLPALRPGFANMQVFTQSGNFVVPNGVSTVKVTVIGGGGSGGYHSTMPSGGGGAGGRAKGIVTGLTPGQVIAVTVGAGGAAPTGPQNGNTGGTSSFGGYMSASGGVGGNGGTAANFSNAGGAGGTASGGQLNMTGSDGSDAIVAGSHGGDGGGPGNGRGASGPLSGFSGHSYGGGGGGGGMTTSGTPVGSPGGAGAAGVVIVEY